MARRMKPGREATVADRAVTSALERSLEQVADRIAEKVAEKLASAVADKLADAFAASIAPEIVDRIASTILNKVTPKAQEQPAKTVQSAARARQTSTESRHKIEPDDHCDDATEAVIWVASGSPVISIDQDSEDMVDRMEVERTAAETPLMEALSKAEGEPQLSLAEPPAPAPSEYRPANLAACGKRRSPEVEDAPPQKRARTATEISSRRNPKRAAHEAAEQAARFAAALPDDPLMEALKPLSPDEIEAWEGWAELESEPAFFNFIVKRLGVKGVTIKELLSLESWALDLLPDPVFGLVFLFQYTPQLDEEKGDDEGSAPVWFANQTTPNSCASVALLNIIMNSRQLELGQRLQAFKESTEHLSSPLRGRRIGANGFIRAAHNSFVRRIDMLEADLCLANEVESAKPRRSSKPAAHRKGRKQGPAASGSGARKKAAPARVPADEFGFHFIAYVPANGFVWELDGMRKSPRNVGSLNSEDWTDVAAPRIRQRIKEYGNSANGFSLLAVCRSPLDTQRTAILSHVSAIRRLRSQFQDDVAFADLVSADNRTPEVVDDEAALGAFGLEQPHLSDAEAPEFARECMSRPDLDAQQAYSLYQQLVAGTEFAMAKYREEAMAVSEEVERVRETERLYAGAALLDDSTSEQGCS